MQKADVIKADTIEFLTFCDAVSFMSTHLSFCATCHSVPVSNITRLHPPLIAH